jgi:hypothetical protein
MRRQASTMPWTDNNRVFIITMFGANKWHMQDFLQVSQLSKIEGAKRREAFGGESAKEPTCAGGVGSGGARRASDPVAAVSGDAAARHHVRGGAGVALAESGGARVADLARGAGDAVAVVAGVALARYAVEQRSLDRAPDA